MDNPYRAPQGEIILPPQSDRPLTWKQILFSFKGRIPRRQFWGALGLVLLGYSLLALVHAFPVGGLRFEFDGELVNSVAFVVLVSGCNVVFWSALAIHVKRWHDMDRPGAMVFLSFLPVLNLVALILCGCVRGTAGPNRFGNDPT